MAYQIFAHVQDRVATWRNPWPEYRFARQPACRRAGSPWPAAASAAPASAWATLTRIPSAQTDFIFAAIGEELGLLGTTADPHQLRAADRHRPAASPSAPTQPFEKLLATGLTTLLGLQAFIIIGGITRLLARCTGVTLAVRELRRLVAARQLVLLALLARDQRRRRQAPAGGSAVRRQRLGAAKAGAGAAREQPDLQARASACWPGLALFATVNYIQIVRADGLDEVSFGCYEVRPSQRNAETPLATCSNTRDFVRDFDRNRGEILTAERRRHRPSVGRQRPRAIASSSSASYPTGDLFGHTTGFLNFSFRRRRGRAGLRRDLSGQSSEIEYRSPSDFFVDRDRVGDVTLTLRNDIQQVARDQLGDRRGSVAAIDPATGRSSPCGRSRATTPTRWPPTTSRTRRRPPALEPDTITSPMIPAAYRRSFFPA